MTVVFRPEAEAELLESQAWYEECSPGLGLDFARAVDTGRPAADPPAESAVALFSTIDGETDGSGRSHLR